MDVFEKNLSFGLHYIFNVYHYPTILFVLILCAGYLHQKTSRLIIAISSFTVGFWLSMFLDQLKLLPRPGISASLLIPLSILLMSLIIILPVKSREKNILFAATFLFGMVHGMGVSGHAQALLAHSVSPLIAILAFNIGIEIGFFLYLLLLLLIQFATHKIMSTQRDFWRILFSGAGLGISFVLLLQGKYL